ncbi:RNA polymerase sigma factor [Mangrovimonas spongiae]|uniref:RNA polymerase sigma factor n=2 Tax=Mangrovimonas spongiae TaxID=2494697 RepID=A0A3R9NWV6_9FLAO|nr:RNA polymerase sigma factor [Mangrovimonas spongiae]
MKDTNDQKIINQVLQGNTAAFVTLVDTYKNLVFSLALQMLKHREEAEEVAQDTFVKVYKSLEKFKGDSKLSTWIYKITYNNCLDRIKKNRTHFNEVPIDSFTERQVKSLDNAFNALVVAERQEAIKNCLGKLPNDEGFLLTLYYFEEKSLNEISKIMGVTQNNVKVKLFRSRKKLATILKQNLEPELIASYEKSNR